MNINVTIEKMKRLLSEASLGEMLVTQNCVYSLNDGGTNKTYFQVNTVPRNDVQERKDAEFYAFARNHLPELLAEIERLNKANEDLQKRLDWESRMPAGVAYQLMELKNGELESRLTRTEQRLAEQSTLCEQTQQTLERQLQQDNFYIEDLSARLTWTEQALEVMRTTLLVLQHERSSMGRAAHKALAEADRILNGDG